MSRPASYLLRWSSQTQEYKLFATAHNEHCDLAIGSSDWFTLLATIPSFAFISRTGTHCTVRKEAIRPSGIYWYGYRSQQRRTLKRYLGRTQDISITRLEELAANLSNVASSPPARTKQAPAKIASSTMLAPLLASQLRPPHLPLELVERPRLFAQLDTWQMSKLTLLSAPAGCGKTTLVASWLASGSPIAPVAWLSLTASANDPLAFWHMLLTACQAWSTTATHDALAQLLAPTPSFLPLRSLTEIVLTFCTAIMREGLTGLLILDDYHALTEPRVHETLNFFIAHLPETLHVLLLTRTDPPLSLARWRASGELHDIPARDLRFTQDEMARFFQLAQAGPFSPATLEILDTHLEGWPAGLRLLTLSLAGNRTPSEMERVLTTLRGAHRPIREYFVAEVLEAQPESLQTFLLQTSVLPCLSASLCVAITGRAESAALLDKLEHAPLFLEALDASGKWYRYQTLFAEAMQHEASLRLGEERLRRIFRQASAWFQQHGLLSEALDTALRAEDFAQAAPLLIEITARMHVFEFQTYHPLRNFLARIPEQLLMQHPRLCFSTALTLAFSREPSELNPQSHSRIEKLLERAEEDWQASNNLAALGEVAAFRAVFSSMLGAPEQSATQATQALAWLSVTAQQGQAASEWRTMSLRVLGVEALRTGQFKQAFQHFQEIEQRHKTQGERSALDGTRLFLGLICLELGALQQASSYFQDLLQRANEIGEALIPTLAQMGEAYICYEQHRLETAQQYIQKLSGLEEESPNPLQSWLHMPLELLQARLQYARGETTQAEQRLANLLPLIHSYTDEFQKYIFHEVLSGLLQCSPAFEGDALAHSRLAGPPFTDLQPALLAAPGQPFNTSAVLPAALVQAERLLADSSLTGKAPVLQGQHTVLLARLALAQGADEVALTMLKQILPSAQVAGHRRRTLQIFLLMTQAHLLLHRPAEARQSLLDGLKQGYVEGHIHTILDEGPALLPLLQDLRFSLRERPLRIYVQKLLSAFASMPHDQPPASPATTSDFLEPLSSQEQRVLRKLVAGLSNAEIARELTVSINTIRSQLQSIYHKLQVHNRQAASELARTLHLL